MRIIACVKSVFAAAFLFAEVGLNAAPFTNGSFELINNHTAISPGTGTILYPTNTWLSGWTVGGLANNGDVGVANDPPAFLEAFDGQQFIVFNSSNTPPGGVLSQTFDTTVGMYYAVTFAVGENGSGNMSLSAAALALDGSQLATNYCIPTSGRWTLFPLGFIS